MADIKYAEPTSTPTNTQLRNVAHNTAGGRDFQVVQFDLGAPGQSAPVSGAMPSTNAAASQADGHSATLGSTGDSDAMPTGIGIWKKIVALITARLPALLGPNGGMKVDIVGGAAATASEITNDVGNPIPVNGTVAVSNFPGTTEITNDAGNPIPVNGSVSVSNFPSATEITNDAGNPVPVSGTVTAADVAGDLTNYSVTTGATALTGAQVLKAAVSTHAHFYAQNVAIDTGVDVWVRPGGTNASAGQPSFRLAAGDKPFEIHGPGARQEWRVFCEAEGVQVTAWGA